MVSQFAEFCPSTSVARGWVGGYLRSMRIASAIAVAVGVLALLLSIAMGLLGLYRGAALVASVAAILISQRLFFVRRGDAKGS